MAFNLDPIDRVVFLHLPRTGGTTLHRLLVGHFEPNEVCPERFNFLGRHSKEELSRYRYFSGHFDQHTTNYIPAPVRIISLFRRPADRILSLYYFWRSHTREFIETANLGGPRIAKSLGLLDFLRHPGDGIPGNIENAQVRNLAGSLSASMAGPEELERAKGCVDRMFCFGLTENMRQSVDLIFQTLGLSPPRTVPKANDLREIATLPITEPVVKEPITPAIQRELARLTTLDDQLYEYAAKLFYDRLSRFSALRQVAKTYALRDRGVLARLLASGSRLIR